MKNFFNSTYYIVLKNDNKSKKFAVDIFYELKKKIPQFRNIKFKKIYFRCCFFMLKLVRIYFS